MPPAARTPKARRERLDRLLVERGLARSRERAQALVLAGVVRIDGRPAGKPGSIVGAEAEVTILAPDHPFVGRGGVKLSGALERLGIAAAGRTALDIGASTGGFTDCLLRRGALRVVALDVGSGQLDWGLRNDPRVVVLEGINARHLVPSDLGSAVDLVVIDVSFISLRLILPRLPPLLAPDADVLSLVKPQFEVGRRQVGRGGVVRDPRLHLQAVESVARAGEAAGLRVRGGCPSPITGAEGNREFFLHFKAADGGPGFDLGDLLGGMVHDPSGSAPD
ncbi:MAG TPA: TlyA family RNA methyltransferase [Candidatus Cryosericum sp.]|nr:TlyA family RNA methyltransferase [Candidatus Cryosericum sp.]